MKRIWKPEDSSYLGSATPSYLLTSAFYLSTQTMASKFTVALSQKQCTDIHLFLSPHFVPAL